MWQTVTQVGRHGGYLSPRVLVMSKYVMRVRVQIAQESHDGNARQDQHANVLGEGTVGQIPPQGPVGQINDIDNTTAWCSGMGGGFPL
jgi:hypothetical protein